MNQKLSLHPRNDGQCNWSRSIDETVEHFATDVSSGLSSTGARERQTSYGRNELLPAKPRSIWSIVADQFKNVVIYLLAAAAALSFAFSEHTEGFAILIVIVLNSGIGFVTEWRATRSMEALRQLGRVDTTVIRDGIPKLIPAVDLVPGDIVLLDAGDIVSADLRLIEATDLQSNESTLTGESLPVAKHTSSLEESTPLMDRTNMVFKGTSITRGNGKGTVVEIGANTEIGRISELAEGAEPQRTPLERRLNMLGGRLAIAAILIAVFIAFFGVLSGRETFLAIEIAVALAVAAIPEGLPVVATIALARGMWRMAQRNALIRNLSAVETLGATSVILTDKTGTLTENLMTVTTLQIPGVDERIELADFKDTVEAAESIRHRESKTSALVEELLSAATLCNNASFEGADNGSTHNVGDPTEVALLAAAREFGIRRSELLERQPELLRIPFDSESKRMATIHDSEAGVLIAVKGAPESVLPLCSRIRTVDGTINFAGKDRDRWLAYVNEFGDRGLRTLAIATKKSPQYRNDAYEELTLLGIVGLEDPPREGVKSAIEQCHACGISVVMVTGDHIATAREIAYELGIAERSAGVSTTVDGPQLSRLLIPSKYAQLTQSRVFSRVTPGQKLALINFYQKQGCVVAMTGDGVNDAPALKKADIGIAMGIRGTAVAKDASHMVLQDDEFGTIVAAISQGRAIYENIRKFVMYLLSCNISEILIVALAIIAGAPLPLMPLQILFLNLVTDVFPALALGVGEGSPELMKNKPRPANQALLTRNHWIRIGLYGALISATVLGAMSIAVFVLEFDMQRAVTVSFCTLAFAQLAHVFNMRDNVRDIRSNEITRNPWIWIAVVVCIVAIIVVIYTPLFSNALSLSDPGIAGWLVILPMSLLPLVFAPLLTWRR